MDHFRFTTADLQGFGVTKNENGVVLNCHDCDQDVIYDQNGEQENISLIKLVNTAVEHECYSEFGDEEDSDD